MEKPNNLDPTNLSTGNELLIDIYSDLESFKVDKEPFNSITTLMTLEEYQEIVSNDRRYKYSYRFRNRVQKNQLEVGQLSIVTLDEFLENGIIYPMECSTILIGIMLLLLVEQY